MLKFTSFLLMATVFVSPPHPLAALANTPAPVKSLQWVINTAPPFHILNGPHAGQGICDVLMDVVDQYLPEISSKRRVLPQTRIRQQFKRQADQCFPCMIYRSTPGDTIQTEPTHFYYPHGIITTKEKALVMQQRHGNPVSLASLISDPGFRFGYPDGRHYPAVQSIVDKALQSNITRVAHTGENATVAILSMIKKDRIDYTLEYQILHNFAMATDGATNLTFLEIAETQGQHVLGAIGCTNNQWGRAAVREINRVLPQVRQHPTFLAVLELWFKNESSDEIYRELLQKHVWHVENQHHDF